MTRIGGRTVSKVEQSGGRVPGWLVKTGIIVFVVAAVVLGWSYGPDWFSSGATSPDTQAFAQAQGQQSQILRTLTEYWQAQRKLPPDPAKFVRDAGVELKDPWGTETQLTLLGPATAEIRSAGPDGQLNTRDDITATVGAQLPAVQTRALLADLVGVLEQYRDGHGGQLPEDAAATLKATQREIKDAWGREVRVQKTDAGAVEIRSAGADGQFGSRDDLTATVEPGK
jgi:hypothetical protein